MDGGMKLSSPEISVIVRSTTEPNIFENPWTAFFLRKLLILSPLLSMTGHQMNRHSSWKNMLRKTDAFISFTKKMKD